MHLEVVWTLEAQSRGVLHAHALLRVPEGLQISSRLIERSWSLGHARVVHYDPSKASGRYMVKDSAEVHHFVGCSRERPCRRHAGCRFSTGVARSRA